MSDSSRRTFLKAAGTGAAVAGAATFVPAGAAGAATPAEDTALPANAHSTMVAYVKDVRRGEVALMVEGHEVTVVDRSLAAHLARVMAAAQRKAARAATTTAH